jgi:predicted glycoside hydrolase/deacetylase ChbG (UPF0249 family)
VAKRLIVNSDDYGRTPDISRGIREAHLKGMVSSTTCMMNMPRILDDIATAMYETPGLKMGVHLVLTAKKPILPKKWTESITDQNGNFLKYDEFIANLPNLKLDEVKAEWRAQIESFIKVAGRRPTHLDSHHHSSFFSPELFRAMLELSVEYNCAIRYPFTEITREIEETSRHVPDLMKEFNPHKPDTFIRKFYDDGATKESLIDIINNVEDGVSELMCHPGYVDEAFATESIYNFQREREFEILTDPSIKQLLESNQIELISFEDL